MNRFEHVLQLRLTRHDLTFLRRMADAQRCTVEELIRKELCLSAAEVLPPHSSDRSHLRLITDEASAG
jgi:hypothetical protein